MSLTETLAATRRQRLTLSLKPKQATVSLCSVRGFVLLLFLLFAPTCLDLPVALWRICLVAINRK